MSNNPKYVGEFEDKYGDTRVVHRDKDGLKLAKMRDTATWALNRAAAELIGDLIRQHRVAANMTLEELCIKSGLVSGTPKVRMWEIEKGTRKGQGIRLGTLYAIARALEIPPSALLPAPQDVFERAGVGMVQPPMQIAITAQAAE